MNYRILLFCIFLSACTGKESTAPSDDENQIRDSRALSNDAIARHDTTSLGTFWTNDFHIVSSRNSEASGKKANLDRFAAEFSSKPDVIYVRTPETVSIYAAWSMAAENGKWKGSWTENGQSIQLSGNYFAKWHKVDGRWLIRAEIFVPLTCSGGDFCKTSPI